MGKTRPEDFEPTNEVRSLKELVREEYFGYQQKGKDGQWYPQVDEGIDDLLKRVFERIEREALATYHSNEPWALRQWALSNILKDEVVNEATNEIAHGLISPVIDWQSSQPFDPVRNFIERLEVERKSERTIQCYKLTAARFVGKVGRKHHYTDDDVLTYLGWANKHFKNEDSYYQECQRVQQFLRRFPGADRHRSLPIIMPKMPQEFYQPTFSAEDVEKIIWACILDNVSGNMVVRLAVATIYGARRSELTELSNEDINLDHDKSTIFIRTKKGGQRKPQPIPKSLVPLFIVPISKLEGRTIQRQLQRICRKAEVPLPFRAGYHSFRRRVVTSISEVEPSDVNVSSFMRWAKPRTMLARYKQTPVEVTDKQILEKHPFVRMWEEAIPYLFKFNSSYGSQLSHPALNDIT